MNRQSIHFILQLDMTELTIQFKKLNDKAITPSQATPWDAGYDLFTTENYILKPGERKLFATHISIAIPYGYYGRIAPRSWLAYKHGIDVLAGVVDTGYRGDIGIIVINLWQEDFAIKEGDKIAQLIIEKCHDVTRKEVEELTESERGIWWRWSTG